ncbi:MAG: hypothetical protein QXZ51_00915 [Candidatus Bathyarchaeia archaeon]
MVSATIDHLAATTVLIVAFTLFMGLFAQVMHDALLYQFHMHLATKCSDILDNMLLSFGDVPGAFGLGDYNLEPYTLDPYLVMRLLSASGPLVEYPPGSGIKYSNISFGAGDYLLVPVSECIDYETAQELLGLKGLYGFRLSLTPIIRISFANVQTGSGGKSISFTVFVEGSGSPIGNANVTCRLLYVSGVDEDGHPIIGLRSTSSTTDLNGKAQIIFSNVDVSKNYVIVASVRVGNFYGVGYIYKQALTSAGNVIPFIENMETGMIILAHSFDVKQYNNTGAIFYNATYFAIDNNWNLVNVPLLGNYSGLLNYGSGTRGKTFNRTQIPEEYLGLPGVLVVVCRKGNEYGVTVMPWQVQSLSFSVEFGGNPYGWEWVATDVRHVLIGGVPYAGKLALWSLTGYQVVTYRW